MKRLICCLLLVTLLGQNGCATTHMNSLRKQVKGIPRELPACLVTTEGIAFELVEYEVTQQYLIGTYWQDEQLITENFHLTRIYRFNDYMLWHPKEDYSYFLALVASIPYVFLILAIYDSATNGINAQPNIPPID